MRPWPPKHDTPESTADAGTGEDDTPAVPDGSTARVPVDWMLAAILAAFALIAVRALARRPRPALR